MSTDTPEKSVDELVAAFRAKIEADANEGLRLAREMGTEDGDTDLYFDYYKKLSDSSIDTLATIFTMRVSEHLDTVNRAQIIASILASTMASAIISSPDRLEAELIIYKFEEALNSALSASPPKGTTLVKNGEVIINGGDLDA